MSRHVANSIKQNQWVTNSPGESARHGRDIPGIVTRGKVAARLRDTAYAYAANQDLPHTVGTHILTDVNDVFQAAINAAWAVHGDRNLGQRAAGGDRAPGRLGSGGPAVSQGRAAVGSPWSHGWGLRQPGGSYNPLLVVLAGRPGTATLG